MTEPSTSIKFRDLRPINLVEGFVLYSRYLLVPLYLALVIGIFHITSDFFKIALGLGLGEAELIEHTMSTLQLLDITMIANLVWLISAGSYYVFVHPYPDTTAHLKRPRSLAHISTGILKEKMAGSLVGVSSVHLLQVFLNVSTQAGLVDINRVGLQIIIHVTLIIGLLAFNYTNKADHHPHNEEKRNANDH